MRKNATAKAFVMSVLALMLCLSMLIGTTFAWFTDSVTSGVNKIVAGNLDVELEYQQVSVNGDGTITYGDWVKVDPTKSLFMPTEGENATLWEPGHTEFVNLRVHNVGTLALKYQLSVSVYGSEDGTLAEQEYTSVLVDETTGVNKKFKLSEHLVYSQKEGATKATSREELWLTGTEEEAAFGKLDKVGDTGTLTPGTHKDLTLTVYMPTWVGNEANYLKGTPIPTIYLGINLFATQVEHESDSFGNDYDKKAWLDHLTPNANGTITDGDKTYVKDNDDYVPVTEDESIPGLYKEVVGEGEESGKLFIVDETSTTEIKENETTGLYETVVEDSADTTLYVLGDTELVEVAPTTETSSLYQEVGGDSTLYAKGFSGVVEVQADSTTEGLYTAVGDDSEKFVTTATAMEAVAPQGGNVTVVENINEVNTSNDYFQDPFLNIPATGTPTQIDLSDKVLSIDSTSGKNGIKVNEGASATFSNGTITMNKGYGTSYGVVDAYKGELTLDNMTVTNEASEGFCVSAGSDHGKVTIKNSTITGSDSPHNPAVFCGSQSTVVIENSTIVGAIRAGSNSKVELHGGDYRNAIMCSENKDRIIIYSGLFSIDPRTDLGSYKHGAKLAPGSTINQNADGEWVVTAAPTAG